MAALYWFKNDLRIDDNVLFKKLTKQYRSLYCCYIVDPQCFNSSVPFNNRIGIHRWQFLKESLEALRDCLQIKNIELLVLYGSPENIIPTLVSELQIDTLACANQVGYQENQLLTTLKKALPRLNIETQWLHTLFDQTFINENSALIGSFSKFRNIIEKRTNQLTSLDERFLNDKLSLNADWLSHGALNTDNLESLRPYRLPSNLAPNLPKLLGGINNQLISSPTNTLSRPIFGGCTSGLKHLEDYFLSGAADHYKQTRNDLHGLRRSTLFSPWLAFGCLSPKQVWRAIVEYEHANQANESTYWIKFELLWREYFQWLALKIGNRLFTFKGLAKTAPKTSFYAERFQKWCAGNTPYQLVNALMNQLNSTGFMSNRGRQIVASCFVNELQLDWRYGASYFEQQLVDYDVASNWGNWQYIAGVGVDPRGGRQFNLEKQSQYYDPDGEFIKIWQGEKHSAPLDSNDNADWPLTIDSSMTKINHVN